MFYPLRIEANGRAAMAPAQKNPTEIFILWDRKKSMVFINPV